MFCRGYKHSAKNSKLIPIAIGTKFEIKRLFLQRLQIPSRLLAK